MIGRASVRLLAAGLCTGACAIAVLGGAAAARTAEQAGRADPRESGKSLPEPDPLLRRLIGFKVRYRDLLRQRTELVRIVRVPYRANDGQIRTAYLLLPRWYGPRVHPPIPLVISPHGRGITPQDNMHFWGGLPAFGPFAVVSPEGQGRVLTLYSWGWRGQIRDLARMPRILERAVPWFHVDRRRVYSVGSSMGGQETLLLVAARPRLLTAAAALDSATNMAARYRALPLIAGGTWTQFLMRLEVGGTPETVPHAYAARSPITYARQIAFSGVPLHIWWSRRDRIVLDQNQESGRLFRTIKRLVPAAPVTQHVGNWAHSKEMYPLTRLPLVLLRLHLIKLDEPLPTFRP